MKQIPHSYQFKVETAGSRLDKFVSEKLPGALTFSGAKLIDDGFVVCQRADGEGQSQNGNRGEN